MGRGVRTSLKAAFLCLAVGASMQACSAGLFNSLLLAKTGYLVYTQSGNEISGFVFDDVSGLLSPLSATPARITTTIPPRLSSVASKFLYCVCQGESAVYGYSIDRDTGALTALSGFPMYVGANAGPIVVDSSNKFVYVGTDSALYGFAVDQSSGALNAVPGSPFAASYLGGDGQLAAAGDFLYAINHDFSAGIACFRIDPSTGGIAPVSGSPFSSGASYSQVAVVKTSGAPSPIGTLTCYATDGATIHAFSVDQSLGALAPISLSPQPLCTGYWCLATCGATMDKAALLFLASFEGVQGYSADQDGQLQQLDSSLFDSRSGQYAATLAPSSSSTRVLFTCGFDDTIFAYQVERGATVSSCPRSPTHTGSQRTAIVTVCLQ